MSRNTTTRGHRCDGCIHWKPLWYSGGTREEPTKCCQYILDTGHQRGDSVGNCTKETVGRVSA